ncbi:MULTISPECIES: hypothetical protein [unclassified Caballeronia]|uniref:hypothetical protein n=1 Tax=unclassified Caballeronia TaxID=2646786 RepID=UPI00202805E7|nr:MULTISPECIES: hypothetical protein [unclassified Caballeronia]
MQSVLASERRRKIVAFAARAGAMAALRPARALGGKAGSAASSGSPELPTTRCRNTAAHARGHTPAHQENVPARPIWRHERVSAAMMPIILGVSGSAMAQETQVVLKNAPGREKVLQCAGCHSLDYIAMDSLFMDRTGWNASANKIINAFGAPIPHEHVDQILDYLAATLDAALSNRRAERFHRRVFP